MTLTVNQRIKIKITRQFVIVGILIGVVYIYFEHGFSGSFHYVNGVIIGFILGLLIALLELFVFARGAKRYKFIWLLALRTLLYFVLITVIIFNVVVFVTYMQRSGLSYMETMQDADFQNYLFGGRFLTAVISTLIFAFSVNFVRMVSRKMGQGMLVSYILGTYYAPVHQTRVIMFINVVDSKRIVHELGPKKLHSFLNDLFYDLTVPVVSNSGIIY